MAEKEPVIIACPFLEYRWAEFASCKRVNDALRAALRNEGFTLGFPATSCEQCQAAREHEQSEFSATATPGLWKKYKGAIRSRCNGMESPRWSIGLDRDTLWHRASELFTRAELEDMFRQCVKLQLKFPASEGGFAAVDADAHLGRIAAAHDLEDVYLSALEIGGDERDTEVI